MADCTDLIARGAAELGLELSSDISRTLSNYLNLLVKWSKKLNLVGPASKREMAVLHVVDALAVVAHLPADLSSMIDVGSGAGLPAIPVAIARPDVRVSAIEPIAKKHAFLATARRELSLSNFTPYCRRFEQHRQSAEFAPYEAAVSRATFALEQWLEHAKTLIRDGGLIIGMEGARQIELLPGLTRHPYNLPKTDTGHERTRALILYQP